MKLTITPTGLPAFLLADGSTAAIAISNWSSGAGGLVLDGFVNKQNRTIQKSLLFRAAYAFQAPRFNWGNSLAFTVQRSFSTIEQCIAFIAFHPDSVPASGEVALSNTSTTGVVTRYLPNAVLKSVECVKHEGLACNFRYAISAPAPWQTTP